MLLVTLSFKFLFLAAKGIMRGFSSQEDLAQKREPPRSPGSDISMASSDSLPADVVMHSPERSQSAGLPSTICSLKVPFLFQALLQDWLNS